MRFSLSDWQHWPKTALGCLNLGSHCVICARVGAMGVDLCDDCESLLHRCVSHEASGYLSGLCLCCGSEMSADSGELICLKCPGTSTPFTRIVAPYRYEFPVDRLIHSLKYADKRVLGRVFGSLLARAVRRHTGEVLRTQANPPLLLPVPLHIDRLRLRGYNQSADIARWCAQDLGLECRSRWVTREHDTGSLAGLTRAERQHRILGAFRARDPVAGRQVAIVDDVLTTGSTARELARELYDTGAESVELWVLARTSSSR